jgi:protease-4
MEDKQPGIIRRFFSGLWALISWTRVAILNVLFIVIVVMIFSSFNTEKLSPLSEPTALRLAPHGFLVDQYSFVDPMTQIFDGGRPEDRETVVSDLISALKHAENDSRVSAVILDLNYFLGGGISKMAEVGEALDAYKTSGKPLIAFADNFSQDRYYLASHADEVVLNPMGAVLLTGYGGYRQYYKDAIDKLGLNFHVFRVGDYKDFVEPYTRNNMSEQSRENNGRLLTELWSVYAEHVEMSRALPSQSLNDYINNLDSKLAEHQGNSAQLALEFGLVDKLATRSELEDKLIKQFGQAKDSREVKALDYWDYLSFVETETQKQHDKVGLIVASGTIIDGDQPAGTIGSESLSELFAQARERKDIKALVLRIDSGGGGVFASEVIYQQVKKTRDTGIPLFISMGSAAASGGYWIAAAGDEIWATPTSITGSIGVFGAFPTLERTFEKLGIHTDGIGTTELAGGMRLDRDISPKASSILQQGVEFTYTKFLNIVANARGMSVEDVHTVAQGQVWSGSQAKELGLVDHLGSLNQVINAAAERADLTSFSVEKLQRELTPKEQFLQQLSGQGQSFVPTKLIDSVAPLALRQALAPILQPFIHISRMTDPMGLYSQCLACVAP